ncbi:MAG: hypothetical protein CL878_15880 [Dehalococcoidia bacterium]|nr:hypothetical protein [Dehalococcoidia bacterium]
MPTPQPVAWWRNSGLVLLLLLFLPPAGGVLAIFSPWHVALKLLSLLWAIMWSAVLLLLVVLPIFVTATSG